MSCHVVLSTKEKVITNIDLSQIDNSHSEKLLVINEVLKNIHYTKNEDFN